MVNRVELRDTDQGHEGTFMELKARWKIFFILAIGCVGLFFMCLVMVIWQSCNGVPQKLVAMQNQINDIERAAGMTDVPANR